MKRAICIKCKKHLDSKVPNDATDIICFRCDNESPNETHQRCFNCNAYADECECDGGIP